MSARQPIPLFVNERSKSFGDFDAIVLLAIRASSEYFNGSCSKYFNLIEEHRINDDYFDKGTRATSAVNQWSY